MDVYLIPAGVDRYELYCETAAPAIDPAEPAGASLWDRMAATFRRAVAEGEQQRLGVAAERPQSRIRRTITRKLADAVAEQRLLWHLRRQQTASLFHPDDMPVPQVMDAMRSLLTIDRDKHRRWCVIDGGLVLLSAPVALLPGPNVLAYYFIFRTVGHYLSMKGAAQGLSGLTWTPVASPDLTAVRAVLPLEPGSRARRLEDISRALGLDRLGLFLERMLDRPS